MAWVSSDDKVAMIDEIICDAFEYGVESVDYYKGVLNAISVIAEYGIEEESSEVSTQ